MSSTGEAGLLGVCREALALLVQLGDAEICVRCCRRRCAPPPSPSGSDGPSSPAPAPVPRASRLRAWASIAEARRALGAAADRLVAVVSRATVRRAGRRRGSRGSTADVAAVRTGSGRGLWRPVSGDEPLDGGAPATGMRLRRRRTGRGGAGHVSGGDGVFPGIAGHVAAISTVTTTTLRRESIAGLPDNGVVALGLVGDAAREMRALVAGLSEASSYVHGCSRQCEGWSSHKKLPTEATCARLLVLAASLQRKPAWDVPPDVGREGTKASRSRDSSGSPAVDSQSPPPGVSILSWHAALLVEAFKEWGNGHIAAGGTITLIDRGSSPDADSDGFHNRLFGGYSGLFRKALEAVLRSDSRGSAVFLACLSVMLNHSRRELAPWMGPGTHRQPIDDLRLALSRPDLFLNAADPSWPAISLEVSCVLLFVLLGALPMLFLGEYVPPPTFSASSPRGCQDGGAKKGPTRQTGTRRAVSPVSDLAKIAFVVWAFAAVEAVFCENAYAVALLLAYYNTDPCHSLPPVGPLAGEPVGSAARLAVGLVTRFGWVVSVPLLARSGSRPYTVAGVAALLSTVVWFIIRFRAAAFMPLEMAGLFVALGLVLAAAAVLACEFVRDPLEIRSRCVVESRRMAKVRATLQDDPLVTFNHGWLGSS